jgi:hypothetical protein
MSVRMSEEDRSRPSIRSEAEKLVETLRSRSPSEWIQFGKALVRDMPMIRSHINRVIDGLNSGELSREEAVSELMKLSDELDVKYNKGQRSSAGRETEL